MRKTLNVRRLSKSAVTDLMNGWLFDPEVITNGEFVEYPSDAKRPTKRGECERGERPCPYVSCAMHLYLDVNPRTGAIKYNFPGLQVEEMSETCALDVAEKAGKRGLPIRALAGAMGLSYDRAFQLVDEAKAKVKQAAREMVGDEDGNDL